MLTPIYLSAVLIKKINKVLQILLFLADGSRMARGWLADGSRMA
ncbi:hypothetical protein [Paenibacillus sp. FSL R7-0652]